MLLLGYLCIIFIAALRLLSNPTIWVETTFAYNASEYIINCFKWIVPGIILFDICRSRFQATVALVIVLVVYTLLAVQVVRWVPWSMVGGGFNRSAYKMLQNEVGYNRVTMSAMLAGASWGVIAAIPLFRRNLHKLMAAGVAGVIVFGQALTGGRTGYVAWVLVGLLMCVIKWRKYLPLIPVVLILVTVTVPGVRDRVLMGFGGNVGGINDGTDAAVMTSGRTVIWPYVIDEIGNAPIIGQGRRAMVRTGLAAQLLEEEGESFPHPHNAYMEVLIDCGFIGLSCILPFYLILGRRAYLLFSNRTDKLFSAIGGASLALISALLIASMGGQTFYPREGAVPLWAAMMLMLRLSVIDEGNAQLADGESTIA